MVLSRLSAPMPLTLLLETQMHACLHELCTLHKVGFCDFMLWHNYAKNRSAKKCHKMVKVALLSAKVVKMGAFGSTFARVRTAYSPFPIFCVRVVAQSVPYKAVWLTLSLEP